MKLLDVETTAQFRKDLKRIDRRHYDLTLLDDVVRALREQKPLDANYRDHALSGKYWGLRECHIQPDWLLIYRVEKTRLVLALARTGTHSDVFEKERRQKRSARKT